MWQTAALCVALMACGGSAPRCVSGEAPPADAWTGNNALVSGKPEGMPVQTVTLPTMLDGWDCASFGGQSEMLRCTVRTEPVTLVLNLRKGIWNVSPGAPLTGDDIASISLQYAPMTGGTAANNPPNVQISTSVLRLTAQMSGTGREIAVNGSFCQGNNGGFPSTVLLRDLRLVLPNGL